jgi:hypothetical protein
MDEYRHRCIETVIAQRLRARGAVVALRWNLSEVRFFHAG